MALQAKAPQTARQQALEEKRAIVGAQQAPAFTIKRLGTSSRYLKLMAYGTYGAGKTLLMATAAEVPSMRDILILDAEAGNLSVATSELSNEAVASIDVVECRSYKQAARLQEFLKAHCALRDLEDEESTAKLLALEKHYLGEGEANSEPRRYRTAIIDSLTEIEAYNMYSLLGVTDRMKLDDEPQAAEWAEYRSNNNMIQRFVRAFRDLPMNILITCAEQYDQDETKRMVYRPSLTGKLSKQVQGFMDMVGYLMVGSPGEDGISPRRLYIQPNVKGKYDAKNRFASFRGSYIDNPTIAKIRQAVKLDNATNATKIASAAKTAKESTSV